MEHRLVIQSRFAEMIRRGEKTKEFRLYSRRMASIAVGDTLVLGSLCVIITAVAHRSSLAAFSRNDLRGSGFSSLAALRDTLRRIYWYRPDGPYIIFSIAPEAPLPQSAP